MRYLDAMWRPDPPPGSESAPALLRALLESDTVHVPAQVADELTELRSRRPTIAWFGINERRVDAVIDTDDDQFRLVYFTDDGASVDDIALYRRPPPLEELAGGQVVVVNGPSGSGKSSVMATLAERSRFPWVLFDEPVIGSVDQPYLIWRDQAPHLHRGFLRAIAALARSGNRVALSAAGHPPALVDEVFSNVPTLRVGLDCDLPTLLRREQGRDGRWGGLVAASLDVHHGWHYDVRLDSAALTPADIVDEILRHTH